MDIILYNFLINSSTKKDYFNVEKPKCNVLIRGRRVLGGYNKNDATLLSKLTLWRGFVCLKRQNSTSHQ